MYMTRRELNLEHKKLLDNEKIIREGARFKGMSSLLISMEQAYERNCREHDILLIVWGSLGTLGAMAVLNFIIQALG